MGFAAQRTTMPHALVPTSNVATRRHGRVVTQHNTAHLELAMRERAPVTWSTAPTAPVVNSLAFASVLEYGATVAISTARAELVQPFVPRTHASPAIVRGQFRPRRLWIGHMETRPTEPAEPQIVRAVAHFGAIAAIKTMFADLSLRTAGLDVSRSGGRVMQ